MSAEVLSENSTNVRTTTATNRTEEPSPKDKLGALRTGMRALSALSPQWTANVAHSLVSTPRRHRRPMRERAYLASARRFEVLFRGQLIRAWQWGEGPTVLLVHGWEGRGAQLAAHVGPLVQAGFRVVTFDAPGHGDSGGRRLTPIIFADAVTAVASWVGGIHAVIAHSMGALATTIAISRGLAVRRLVFLGPALSLPKTAEWFARALDLAPSVVDVLRDRMAQELGTDWSAIARGDIFDAMSTPLLILHDRHDEDVPVSASVAAAQRWSSCELVITRDLGHRRIMWDDEVIDRALRFLASITEEPAPVVDPWQNILSMDLSTFDRD